MHQHRHCVSVRTWERETGEVRGCAVAVCALCAVWVLEEGCKRYPCLFPTCPTLTLLHPGQPGKEWGSLGNWTGQGGREGGSMEARLSATMKRSGIKYKQNLFQYTVSLTWVGQLTERRSAGATVQWGQGGQQRRGDVVNLTGEWGKNKKKGEEREVSSATY